MIPEKGEILCFSLHQIHAGESCLLYMEQKAEVLYNM